MSGQTTVSGVLENASGVPSANATIYFQPISWPSQRPTSFLGGDNHQNTYEPVSVQADGSGAFSLSLADTTLTKPLHVGYRIWAVGFLSGATILEYACIQPSGGTWSLDTDFDPTAAPVATGGVPTGGGGGGGGPLAGVTLIDSADASHYTLTVASGVETLVGGGSDIGTPAAGITFIDSVDSSHWNYVVTSGVGTISPATSGDVATAVASVTFTDSVTSTSVVLAVSAGVLTIT